MGFDALRGFGVDAAYLVTCVFVWFVFRGFGFAIVAYGGLCLLAYSCLCGVWLVYLVIGVGLAVWYGLRTWLLCCCYVCCFLLRFEVY